MDKQKRNLKCVVEECDPKIIDSNENENYWKADSLISTYLMREKKQQIKALEKTKKILENQKNRAKKQMYQVSIWAEGFNYQLFRKKYHGSISSIVRTAEEEFLRHNNIDTITPMIPSSFDVYLCVGKEALHVPKEYWMKYTKQR